MMASSISLAKASNKGSILLSIAFCLLLFSSPLLMMAPFAEGKEQQQQPKAAPTMAKYLQQLFVPFPVPGPQMDAKPPANSSSSTTASSGQMAMVVGQQAILANQVPALPFCRLGQRFIVNHILFGCHQWGEQRRGFKPFACAIRNHPESKLMTRNGTLDDQFFRYKCQDSGDGTLRLQALNCILNEIEVRAGQSLRRGRSEYLCIRDSQGLFKLMEKQMLHDFCLPGNRNESLLDSDKCPGLTVGTIHAAFGSGSEVIFDTRLMTVVPRESNKKRGGGEDSSADGKKRGVEDSGSTSAVAAGVKTQQQQKEEADNKKSRKKSKKEKKAANANANANAVAAALTAKATTTSAAATAEGQQQQQRRAASV